MIECATDTQKKPDLKWQMLRQAIRISWDTIPPLWPLSQCIAVNPLCGFETWPFERAMQMGQIYFGHHDLPTEMQNVNTESMKWLQAFFDAGQAAIQMPLKHLGLLRSVHALLHFEPRMHIALHPLMIQWNQKIPADIESMMCDCLLYLNIHERQYTEYLTLILTTLPGWAAYIQYQINWSCAHKKNAHPYQMEYIALRLFLVCILYPKGRHLLKWHKICGLNRRNTIWSMDHLKQQEIQYSNYLFKKISTQITHQDRITARMDRPEAQFIFCIDVRSEHLRSLLEIQGPYETYGCAGFFGMPIAIHNGSASYAACPVAVQPAHSVGVRHRHPTHLKKIQKCFHWIKKIYQSLKYNMVTPFVLAEALGPVSGVLMVLRTFAPTVWLRLNDMTHLDRIKHIQTIDLKKIPLKKQCAYALSFLRLMGLVHYFAPLVVVCGHGSQSQNNPHAALLNCAACGGAHGGINALTASLILNRDAVRTFLKTHHIHIPQSTYFIAAEHNTTTNDVHFFEHDLPEEIKNKVLQLKQDLEKAKKNNALKKSPACTTHLLHNPEQRAKDWAQMRPEWGVSGHASFIIGSRQLTKNLVLDGRSFLHSYDWRIDHDGLLLATILTAPLRVVQWMNAQYLCSTYDHAVFGGGSKMTHNVVGTIGVMQGNGSDLMYGLPLQSVFQSDREAHHQPLRLLVVVCAPRSLIDPIIAQQKMLNNLLCNEWIFLAHIDPFNQMIYRFNQEHQWIAVEQCATPKVSN